MTAPMREEAESDTVIENAFRDAHVKAYGRAIALRIAYEDSLPREECEEVQKDFLYNLEYSVPETCFFQK